MSGVLHGVDEQHGVCCAFPLQTAATATVGPASVTKAGSERPASSRRSVNYPARRAKSCAGTHRGWCAPTEVPRPQRTHKQTRTDTPHSSEKRSTSQDLSVSSNRPQTNWRNPDKIYTFCIFLTVFLH